MTDKIDAIGYMRLAMSNIADAARLQGLISEEHCRRITHAIWSDTVAEAIPARTSSVASVASGVEAQ
jgi:hypothetical protein